MIQQMATVGTSGFEWFDINDPSGDELLTIAEKYHLHPALVHDCLQPDHLPKYERMDKYAFVIFRVYADAEVPEADTIQELTHKIAVFYADRFIITVHRHKQQLLEQLGEVIKSQKCDSPSELLNMLIFECLNTYQQPLKKLSKEVDYYEEVVFLRPKKISLLKGLYYVKRKIDLVRRMLILSFDIIDSIDAETGNVNTRDTRDHYLKFQHMFDALSENIHQLLNIYFSVSAQKTSETMRILTIFSVFFMPLTFIVGVYGMNFDFMPELKWRLGYPVVMGAMAVVTFIIYLWFRKKRWL